MASISDYFATDFRHDLKTRQTVLIGLTGRGQSIEVVEQVHMDFNSRAKYISYFVPESPHATEVCKTLIGSAAGRLSEPQSVAVVSGFVGEDGMDSADLLITGRLFLYTESELSEHDLSELHDLANAQDLSLVIRGPGMAAERSKLERPQAFICHDSRDKDQVARPLAIELSRRMCPVWYDEFSLKIGDNLREAIEAGIRETEKCIIVVSPNFLTNEGWSRREFDAIYTKEIVEKNNVILPIWHEVDEEGVYAYSPALAGRVAAKWDQGLEEVAKQIYNSLVAS